jgi:hypothetical protein
LKTYTATFTAMAPLSHSAFGDSSSGNAMMFRREPILSEDGSRPRVPVISGNAIRGAMRRIVMRELLASCGITPEFLEGKVGSKSRRMFDRLYAALAQGGTIEEMETAVSPTELRALRKSLPPLSLFGSAMYSFLLPGMMSVGFAYPLCKETIAAGLIPMSETEPLNAEELISDTGLVRHIDRELAEPEQSGVTPMPYTTEVLAIGTVLQSRIKVEDQASEIETACLMHGLHELQFIGGKKGSGFGAVRVAVAPSVEIEPYTAWLQNTDTNREALLALAEKIS